MIPENIAENYRAMKEAQGGTWAEFADSLEADPSYSPALVAWAREQTDDEPEGDETAEDDGEATE